MNQNNEQDLYRIGTVASLTGLSVERLRAWERRYDLAPAHKAGKTRFYSKPQLERLKLIKRLTDSGHAISSLAPLSSEQLQARLDEEQSSPTLFAAHPPKVGLVGSGLQILEQQTISAQHPSRIEVVSRWANLERFAEERSSADQPQILFLQLQVLSLQTIDLVNKIYPNCKIVAIYQFATARQVSDFQARDVQVLKWPVSWPEIEHAAITQQGAGAQQGWAPNRFSDEELIAIAATNTDPSQCPQYLIESINQLNALVAYTADVAESGINDHTGNTTQTYRVAAQLVSQARAQLETTLETMVGDDVDGMEGF